MKSYLNALLSAALLFSSGLAFSEKSPLKNEGQAFYELSAKRLRENEEFAFSSFKNKVVLIVNTASKCGYTGQLDGLQKLYDKYKEQGFEVVAFPSNDFKQEDLEGGEIANFCKLNYGVNFTILEKTHVKGEKRHVVYDYLVKNSTPPSQDVAWNFEKFLVDKNGKVIARFPSATRADAPDLIKKIEKALATEGTKKA